MERIYADNSQSIGNTPLVRLNRVSQGAGATVVAKIEGRNPSYSVKCRIGASMIWAAEKAGILKPGSREREEQSRGVHFPARRRFARNTALPTFSFLR